ncbi:ATP-binding protein [Albidovulum sediminicola]|uniref:histidine kinase n=1 Tax=Albidovulum sediminicola TaxID=2984331 RepID=A0ABT2Z6K2_9RHOB|nr:ATP-binding protein [Defluviimonas sp. WL0075]MCV2866768.1 ATP-binding protein [Defluviimonas sp. WL0075]
MRTRRFDKQLQFVFMVLSGLMLVVGLASFGVNRFLAQSLQTVLSESIAIIERTDRVAQDADFAASLAGQLAGAVSEAQVAELSHALDGRVDSMESDLAAMGAFLGRGPLPGAADAVRALVQRMDQTVRQLIVADAAMLKERDGLAEAGSRLAALIATETDLARLRITAGVWELYALPQGGDPRPGLDRLADVNFFAYERLAEMAEATAALDRLVLRTTEARGTEEAVALRAEFQGALALARDRSRFMLAEASRAEARSELATLDRTLGDEGLFARRASGLAARAELDDLSGLLDVQLERLIGTARVAREETRGHMQQGIASARWQATLVSAALAAVILLALLAGSLVWARTRRKVVLRLGDVAERMVAVAGGDFGEPMAISGPDEIGRLEKALNILRRRAEEAAHLRNRLEAAVMDRTADVVAEMQSANAARADAEEQSRAKTQFLARMSHEIRTPLNGLIGLLDLLAEDERDEGRRTRLDIALTSARDLQSLTEDILAFSAGEEAGGGLLQQAFDPSALARGLGEHLGVLASAKGLAAVIDIPEGLPPAVMGEPTKIRQVMMNLLSNAVKYTERGQVRLSVSARTTETDLHEISFAVKDTGPGMTSEEAQLAFDIYGRSLRARQRGVPGVGLGLAIVRQLTDAMGGELRVATAPQRGSSFTLVLQLPGAEVVKIAAAAPLSQPRGEKRVLVVDDHPVNRLVARGYLERMGCKVSEAATGEAALGAAAEGRFDAILVDLGLPDMPGEDVAARIERKGAIVAVLTADLVQDDAATRARFGVDRVLTKPVSPRLLASVLFGDQLTGGGSPDAVPPDAPASETETILNEDVERLGADTTSEIVTALLADLAEAIPRLLGETDPVARRKLAHRLKGAAANFRLDELCAVLRRIQSDEAAALALLEAVAARAARDLAAAARRAGLTV